MVFKVFGSLDRNSVKPECAEFFGRKEGSERSLFSPTFSYIETFDLIFFKKSTCAWSNNPLSY